MIEYIKEGKYKGYAIDQVPDNYLLWMTNQKSFSKDYNQETRDKIFTRLSNRPKKAPRVNLW